MASSAMEALLPLLQPWAVIPARYWHRRKDLFFYTRNFITGDNLAAASVTTSADVPINNDSDFLCVQLAGTFFATDNTTAVTAPMPFLLQVTDSSSRVLFDRPAQVMNVLSSVNGIRTGVNGLDIPRLFEGGTSVTFALTNHSATDRHVRITMRGVKIFPQRE